MHACIPELQNGEQRGTHLTGICSRLIRRKHTLEYASAQLIDAYISAIGRVRKYRTSTCYARRFASGRIVADPDCFLVHRCIEAVTSTLRASVSA
jgi:hypothetical protein